MSAERLIVRGAREHNLKNVSLDLPRNAMIVFTGLSGSGKSTFLRLVLREEKPTSGKIHVAGKDLTRISNWKVPELRRQVGTVFQDFRLLPNKTVSENVAFTLYVLGFSRKEIAREVPEVLELVGLEDKGDRKPGELSGGEQQRVVIARALVNDPVVLLADEPTGNLDPATSMEILELLKTINMRGTAIILATHNYELVKKSGSRVLQLKEGKLTEIQMV